MSRQLKFLSNFKESLFESFSSVQLKMLTIFLGDVHVLFICNSSELLEFFNIEGFIKTD